MNIAPNAITSLGLPMVYLVDDEDVVRDALAWLLRSRRLLSEGFTSAEAFEAICRRQRQTWPIGHAAPRACCWMCACPA
jgi:hypothetical protein